MTAVPWSFALDCIEIGRKKFRKDQSKSTNKPTPSPSPELTPAQNEAVSYNAGLPSAPRLLARNGGPARRPPPGPCLSPVLRQLGVVVGHKLNSEWEFEVAPKIQACLDDLQVKWTSLDIVRMGTADSNSGAVTLWIGARGETLDGELANTAVYRCLDVLQSVGIADVNVEIRDSSVFRSAGPPLLKPSSDVVDLTSDLGGNPFTHALDLNISPLSAPSSSGTGSFFMSQGDTSTPLLLITARHTVFPPTSKTPNNEFEHKTNTTEPRSDILLLSDTAFASYLSSIQAQIGSHAIELKRGKQRIEAIHFQVTRHGGDAEKDLPWIRDKIRDAEGAMDALYDVYNNIKANWGTTESRILGRVVYSPPIVLGAGAADEGFTQDYAVVEIDDGKIDRAGFRGNVLELGRGMDVLWDFTKKMNAEAPSDGFLKLRGTISLEEMRHPTMLDGNGDPCIVVLKKGSATGTTFGRASSIMSFVREYSEGGITYQTSKEWPVLPFDRDAGAFSAMGDSGAVVVDRGGRMGGIVTGGSGTRAEELDVTYVTPIEPLLRSIRHRFPDACLDLV